MKILASMALQQYVTWHRVVLGGCISNCTSTWATLSSQGTGVGMAHIGGWHTGRNVRRHLLFCEFENVASMRALTAPVASSSAQKPSSPIHFYHLSHKLNKTSNRIIRHVLCYFRLSTSRRWRLRITVFVRLQCVLCVSDHHQVER